MVMGAGLALAMTVVLAACTPGAPPPQYVSSPAVGTSAPAAFPGSTPDQQALLFACVPDGAVITAELERLDTTPAFNDEWIVQIRDVGGVDEATATFPWQWLGGQDPATNATYESAPVPGPRCVQILLKAPRYFSLDSPRFSYRVTW
jgi:hypothetical protein